MVIERVHRLVEVVGMPRAVASCCWHSRRCSASTWKQLVQSLYIGMSGREWLVKASVFLALAFLAVVVPLAHWIIDQQARWPCCGTTSRWILGGPGLLQAVRRRLDRHAAP